MTSFTLSVDVPTVDNSAALAALARDIAFEWRRAERAADFLSLPFAREDAVIQNVVNDFLLDCGERTWVASETASHLHFEHGAEAPTQETWDALQEWERELLADEYIEHDCITGHWEFNPWGPLIERNCNAFRRH